MFWMSINNNEVTDGLKDDESIQQVLQEIRDNSEDEDADGESSRSEKLTMSSAARHPGRHAGLILSIPS